MEFKICGNRIAAVFITTIFIESGFYAQFMKRQGIFANDIVRVFHVFYIYFCGDVMKYFVCRFQFSGFLDFVEGQYSQGAENTVYGIWDHVLGLTKQIL